MKDMLFIDDFILIEVIPRGSYVISMPIIYETYSRN